MFWNRYFWPSFSVLILVTSLHWIGSIWDLYNGIWWYDIPTHLFGGLWVYLFVLWISHTQYVSKLKRFVSVRNVLIITLAVGVAWEIYELVFRFDEWGRAGYFIDMPMDLVMDMLGASLGAYFYKK